MNYDPSGKPYKHNDEQSEAAKADLQQRAGSPALTWREHPTRAGWWVRWMRHSGGTLEALLVEEITPGQLVIRNGSIYEPAEAWPGRWAGPIESPSASPAATPENESSSATRGENL